LTLFGHDAPNWDSVPDNVKLKYSSRRGGLQLSFDQGGSWKPLNSNLPEQPIRALVINPAGVMFAGLAGSGVFRSNDRGVTWEQVSIGLTNLDVNALHVDERGYVFAGTANGVFRSADNGNQWESLRGEFRIRRLPLLSPLDTQLPITPARALLTLSGPDDQRTYLFAGTDRGIFRWASDSTGWQPVNHGMPHRDDDSGEASVAVFSW
jgi:ligand-binding sensor domain-containing protein